MCQQVDFHRRVLMLVNVWREERVDSHQSLCDFSRKVREEASGNVFIDDNGFEQLTR